jgi:hypothetical protein
MYNLMNAEMPFLAGLYTISIVLFGSYFLMNLILAVIIQAFIRTTKSGYEEEIEVLEKLKRQRESLQASSAKPRGQLREADEGGREGQNEEGEEGDSERRLKREDSSLKKSLGFIKDRTLAKKVVNLFAITKSKEPSGASPPITQQEEDGDASLSPFHLAKTLMNIKSQAADDTASGHLQQERSPGGE